MSYVTLTPSGVRLRFTLAEIFPEQGDGFSLDPRL